MNLVQKTEPAVEPVTLAEAKAHMRVTITDDDDLITAMITAARQYAELYTLRSFITQQWYLYFDHHDRNLMPPLLLDWTRRHNKIRLRRPPLQTLDAFEYQATAGTWTAVDSSIYYLDAGFPQIVLTDCLPDPAVNASAYRLTYTAGYGDAGSNVPEPIKLAIKTIVLHFYENRAAFDVSNLMPVPAAGDALLMKYAKMDY